MDLDYKKILGEAKLPIIIGLAAQVLLLIAFFALTRVTDEPTSDIIMLGLFAFTFIFYLALFIWSGYRAVKTFGYDIIGAGIASAVAYLGIGLISLPLIIVFLIVLGAVFFLGSGKTGASDDASSGLMLGALSSGLMFLLLVMMVVIYIFELVLGACVNFAVGCVGGWFAGRK